MTLTGTIGTDVIAHPWLHIKLISFIPKKNESVLSIAHGRAWLDPVMPTSVVMEIAKRSLDTPPPLNTCPVVNFLWIKSKQIFAHRCSILSANEVCDKVLLWDAAMTSCHAHCCYSRPRLASHCHPVYKRCTKQIHYGAKLFTYVFLGVSARFLQICWCHCD